jgi:hypothetical protein
LTTTPYNEPDLCPHCINSEDKDECPNVEEHITFVVGVEDDPEMPAHLYGCGCEYCTELYRSLK